MPELQANNCVGCGVSLEGTQAWVRSGRLLCDGCDHVHRSPGHAAQVHEHVPHTPRPRDYYKGQWHDDSPQFSSWRDVQRVCSSAEEALSIARDQAPFRAKWVRAMHITDKDRTPGTTEPRGVSSPQ